MQVGCHVGYKSMHIREGLRKTAAWNPAKALLDRYRLEALQEAGDAILRRINEVG